MVILKHNAYGDLKTT